MVPKRCCILHVHACICVTCKCTWYRYLQFEGCRIALFCFLIWYELSKQLWFKMWFFITSKNDILWGNRYILTCIWNLIIGDLFNTEGILIEHVHFHIHVHFHAICLLFKILHQWYCTCDNYLIINYHVFFFYFWLN